MAEYLVVPEPGGPAPTPVTPDAARRAVRDVWPTATFPDPPPSVVVTAWIAEADDLVLDLHHDGATLTVQCPGEIDGLAQWWCDVIGAAMWATDVSGVGYSRFTPGR